LAWSKFDAGLQKEIRRNPSRTAELPVLICVAGMPRKREGSVENKEARFAESVGDLVRELESLGTRNMVRYWINWTVSALANIGALNEIGKRADVRSIQLQVRHKTVC